MAPLQLAPLTWLFQIPISLGINLQLLAGPPVLRRDGAVGTVHTDVAVMVYVTLNQTPHLFKEQRRPCATGLPPEYFASAT